MVSKLYEMIATSNGRCLLYTKRDWFRTLVCQILLGSVMAFVAYSWVELHVLYDEASRADPYPSPSGRTKLTRL